MIVNRKLPLISAFLRSGLMMLLLTAICGIDVASGQGTPDKTPPLQQKIDEAFVEAQQSQDVAALVKLREELSARGYDQTARYWSAYASYQIALSHFIAKDTEKSRAILEEAIKALDGQTEKNAEDYTLLAFLQSFSAQFSKGMQAGMIASSAKKNAERALKLDAGNPRAYYVLGMVDFYTPEEFGGKLKAEEYLKKSISLPLVSPAMQESPTWGRNMAYELLVSHYLAENDKSKAQAYLKQGLARYPDDYQLLALSKKLK